MISNKSFVLSLLFIFSFLLPSVSSASTLTADQTSAIIGLLQAFDVDPSVVNTVEQVLGVSTNSLASTTPVQLVAPHVSPIGSPYPSSTLGFDISYATSYYPADSFGFAVIGVTRGKAFVDNPRLVSEYAWSHFGSATAATIYMNLNAPYGSTVAGNSSAPQVCPPSISTSTEPTACQGYNYGYNAAQHSYAYAKSNGMTSSLWWLDIEEANSWSTDTGVNDATIQGAIAYLNSQNIRVGIYSIPFMWKNIAGTYVPTQMLGGSTTPIPTWFPIGTTNLVGAINTCSTISSFIFGSPVWVVQYEANSTAIDQNIAC
jgi:hypothetical protein